MKKKTGSIDDITPEEWSEMNRKHLEEKAAEKRASRFTYGIPATELNPDDVAFTYGDAVTLGDVTNSGAIEINLSDNMSGLSFPDFDMTNYTISFPEPSIEYKFREDELIKELKDYIDSTYSQHYCQSGIQSSEVIVDRGRGIGFFLGNVDKYNARYGNKGTKDDHRKDLMKILHYALLALYVHDRENPKEYSVSVTD